MCYYLNVHFQGQRVKSGFLATASVADNKNSIVQSFFLLGELNKFTILCVDKCSGLCVGGVVSVLCICEMLHLY